MASKDVYPISKDIYNFYQPSFEVLSKEQLQLYLKIAKKTTNDTDFLYQNIRMQNGIWIGKKCILKKYWQYFIVEFREIPFMTEVPVLQFYKPETSNYIIILGKLYQPDNVSVRCYEYTNQRLKRADVNETLTRLITYATI